MRLPSLSAPRSASTGVATAARRPRPSAPVPGRPPRWQRRYRRQRRWLAAALAGVVTWSVLSAVRPAPPPTVSVLVARHDLAPGSSLRGSDLALEPRPEPGLADDAVRSLDAAVGRTVVFPVHAGEPVLVRHLLTDVLLDQLGPGTLATTVRLADPAAVALLGAGDVVDVLSAQGDVAGATAAVVASGVRVLVAPDSERADAGGGILGGPASTGSSASAVLVLATTASEALALARAQVAGHLSVVLRHPG